eukprot:gene2408-2443_t
MTGMTVIEISSPGGPEVLVAAQRPVPEIGPSEILVKVAAAGVNRPDVLQRMGAYPPPPGASDLPGLEVSGEVVAVGAQVTAHKIGDHVCALTAGGGYAEYAKVEAGHALPVPTGLTLIEAAAIPETFFTVWTNVFERGGLKAGEVLLVHGGTSGIGTTAIMLAKAFGATVITTVGSADKCTACLKLGADFALNYNEVDFVAEVKRLTGGRGADVILDMVGGDYTNRNYDAAAVEGRIVQIAFLKTPKVNVDLRLLMTKRLHHTGSTLRPRSNADKTVFSQNLFKNVWPLLEQGRCKPLIDSVFDLKDVAKAHERMESSAHIGKIVLRV